MKNEKYKPVASLFAVCEQRAIAKQLSKILLLIIFLGSLISPLIASAAGLVPCGGEGEDPCTLCHFFLMFKNIVDFVLFTLVPVVAVLMLVIGGFMFFFAGGSPEALSRAKSIITSTVIGLLVIYAAWLIVNTFFVIIGVADWTGLKGGWFSIDCPVP
jgi:hypothetical protein